MHVRFYFQLLALLICTHAAAHSPADAHQHGSAQLDLAFSGAQFELWLSAPAEALVGFEHAPQTSAQHSQLAQRLATLKQPEQLIKLPESARCQWSKPDIDHVQRAAHAHITGRYQANCQSPLSVTRVDLRPWFERFSGLNSIRVNVVTDQAQHAYRATPAQPFMSIGQ